MRSAFEETANPRMRRRASPRARTAAPLAGGRSGARVAPAQGGALVARIGRVASPVDAVLRRDDHIFEHLALGQARVVEQYASHEPAVAAQDAAVAQPGGPHDR